MITKYNKNPIYNTVEDMRKNGRNLVAGYNVYILGRDQ